MRILLDENLDWRLGRDLPGHTVESVPLIGWAGLKNGALLTEAEKRFDVLLTMDSNMVYQQNLSSFHIAVLALKARSNRLAAGKGPPLAACSTGAAEVLFWFV